MWLKMGKTAVEDSVCYVVTRSVLTKRFNLNIPNNACKPGVKQMIIDMAMNASGTRDTGRVLGVSKDTVTATLKKQKNSPNKSTKNFSNNLILVDKLT